MLSFNSPKSIRGLDALLVSKSSIGNSFYHHTNRIEVRPRAYGMRLDQSLASDPSPPRHPPRTHGLIYGQRLGASRGPFLEMTELPAMRTTMVAVVAGTKPLAVPIKAIPYVLLEKKTISTGPQQPLVPAVAATTG